MLETHRTNNRGIFTRFQELSKRKQTSLIVYGIWILSWICFLIANADSSHFAEDYVMPFFLFTIVIPSCVVGGLHIYRINKEKKINRDFSKSDVSNSTQSCIQNKINGQKSIFPIESELTIKEEPSTMIETDICHQVISSELLLNFARSNGKMQVVNKTISDGIRDHYCQFTSEDGKITRVNFSDRTRGLGSQEISEKKYQLTVNKLADGTYCLDFMDAKLEAKQIEDFLPF